MNTWAGQCGIYILQSGAGNTIAGCLGVHRMVMSDGLASKRDKSQGSVRDTQSLTDYLAECVFDTVLVCAIRLLSGVFPASFEACVKKWKKCLYVYDILVDLNL